MDTPRRASCCALLLLALALLVLLADTASAAPAEEPPKPAEEQVEQTVAAGAARPRAGGASTAAVDFAGALTRALSSALLRGSGAGGGAGVGATLGAALPALVARNYKKMAQTILPLLVGFKATGMLVMAMAVTKFVLLKALFLSTTALLIAALVALKKFLSSGQPHDVPAVYTYQHQDLSHIPYLHHAGAEYMDASQVAMPQVTYIGGSYGLQTMPYAATAGAALGAAGGLGATAAGDDAQGLYAAHSNNVAAVTQLHQLQQLQQQQALLAANATQQAGHHLLRRRLSAPHAATALSLHRPVRTGTGTEARPA